MPRMTLTAWILSLMLLMAEDAIAEIPVLSAAQPLTVTCKYGGGSVHGTIEECGTARVMLIPRDPVLWRIEFWRETHLRRERPIRNCGGSPRRVLRLRNWRREFLQMVRRGVGRGSARAPGEQDHGARK
jgi:hypothetical protein